MVFGVWSLEFGVWSLEWDWEVRWMVITLNGKLAVAATTFCPNFTRIVTNCGPIYTSFVAQLENVIYSLEA